MKTLEKSREPAVGVTSYVAVGTGGRIPMFIDPIANEYRNSAKLLALCDASLVRARYHAQRLEKTFGYGELPIYHAADFDRMIETHKPDCVIVCSPDHTHNEYIRRSVQHGCDVVCEKPIATDVGKCQSILDAVAETSKRVRVTFNYRWTPGVTEVRKRVAAGEIGTVRHIHLEYLLNTRHGADYFRRWHSQKECSGGLLVHKATHHFDLANWIVDAIPEVVYANGAFVFYGKQNAIARGDEAFTRYDRYADSASEGDPFRLDMNRHEEMRELYLKAEEESGYIRDRNVFREGITIEDSLSVQVKFRNGLLMNYSLNAFCPYEGYRIYLTGDRGRIEYEERHAAHIIRGQTNEALAAEQQADDQWSKLVVLPLFKTPFEVRIPEADGSHGGGDPLLQEQIFSRNPPEDSFHRNAGHEQGIASAMVGIAANQSMETGQPVRISDLISLRPGCEHLSELT